MTVFPSTDVLDQIKWLIQEGSRLLDNDSSCDGSPGKRRLKLSPEKDAMLSQQRGFRRRAKSRFPFPERWLWTDKSLSQASDWWCAQFKASLLPSGSTIVDACCGAGADTVLLSTRGPVWAVDIDPVMGELTRANARTHHGASDSEKRFPVNTAAQSIEEFLADPNASASGWKDAWLHVDPDRRPQARKTRCADQFSPPLESVLEIAKRFRGAVVKLAPSTILDGDLEAALERDSVRCWLGNQGECRQQILLLGELATSHVLNQLKSELIIGPGKRVAVLCEPGSEPSEVAVFADVYREASSDFADYVDWKSEPETFVYDLHATLHAADLQVEWGRQHELQPLGGEHGFFTGASMIESPWAQAFEVIDVLPWDDRKVRKWLRAYRPGVVEVKTRLAKVDANLYQRRYSGDGSQAVTLLVTQLGQRIRAIAARRI